MMVSTSKERKGSLNMATSEEHEAVMRKLREELGSINLDVWKLSNQQMVELLESMFNQLDLLSPLSLSSLRLRRFLLRASGGYKCNSFHNFRHAFCVTHMMFVLIELCELRVHFTHLELAALLITAITHDLGHPGRSNSFQINAGTELAKRFEHSPLENLHLESCLQLLESKSTDLLFNCNAEQRRGVIEDIRLMILATDMGHHNRIMSDFHTILANNFDMDNQQHRQCLKAVLIKAADVSNECRPVTVAEPWADALLEEYFDQSDAEKRLGLPFAPFMDRSVVRKASSQINFIQAVLIPLFQDLAKVFPRVDEVMGHNLRMALKHYRGQQ